MQGFPSNLYQHCKTTLLKCDEFDDARSLRSVFLIGKLYSLRDQVPNATSRSGRVDVCLQFLFDQHLEDGQAALLPFLQELRDRYPCEDARHSELHSLADEVESWFDQEYREWLIDTLKGFSVEEIRALCSDLGIDYSKLLGETKTDKALQLMWDFRDLLTEIGKAIKGRYPEKSWKHPTGESHLLHLQLEEWKDVHNILQELQISFGPCRGYIAEYSWLRSVKSLKVRKRREDEILRDIERFWEHCNIVLVKLRVQAKNTRYIGTPYDPGGGGGPDWYIQIIEVAGEIRNALLKHDTEDVSEALSKFNMRVNEYLYLADQALRKIVKKINAPIPI